MKKLVNALLAGMLLVAAGCSDTPDAPKPEKEAHDFTISDPCKVVSRSAQQLDIKVFQAANALSEQNTNVLISPLNITTYLGMMSNVIDSKDLKAAILEYFGTDDVEVVNELVSSYMKQLSELDPQCDVTFLIII